MANKNRQVMAPGSNIEMCYKDMLDDERFERLKKRNAEFKEKYGSTYGKWEKAFGR